MSGVSGKNSYEDSLVRVPKLYDLSVAGCREDTAVLVVGYGGNLPRVSIRNGLVRFPDFDCRARRGLALGSSDDTNNGKQHCRPDQGASHPDMIQNNESFSINQSDNIPYRMQYASGLLGFALLFPIQAQTFSFDDAQTVLKTYCQHCHQGKSPAAR